jgi:hypothetical protein
VNPLLALAIFICSVADDVLVVFYYRRVNVNNKKLQASLLSGSLTAMVSFAVIFYTTDWRYVIPNVLGSMIGTPLAIWIDSRWPPREKARDARGKFKSPISTAQAMAPSEKGL